MKRNTHSSSPAVGGSSLLVIFAVLSLCVFAFLSISTAQADRHLSDAAAQGIPHYYAADSKAEEIFALLRSGELPPDVTVSGSHYSYSCEISQHQRLYVTLLLEDGRWQILRWQAVAEAPALPGETMPVWNGETP